jgi:hypothetical protein
MILNVTLNCLGNMNNETSLKVSSGCRVKDLSQCEKYRPALRETYAAECEQILTGKSTCLLVYCNYLR